MKRYLRRGAVGFGALAVLAALLAASLGFEGVTAEDAEPLELPDEGFSHEALGRALSAHVRRGRVDYPALAEERTGLRRYAATLETVGPESTPERFESREARLSYYINAYNALVLLAVAQRWPIESIHDVRGLIEPTAGFGFFYALGFRLDGDWINLWELEHDVLRARFEDARVHAAMVCASVSCPDLTGAPYVPERLDAQLDDAMRRFVGSEAHVRIDDDARRIVLNPIFDWFEEDFVRDARRLGAGDSVLDYVERFADDDERAALERARREGYEVVHGEYDWRINAIPDAAGARGRLVRLVGRSTTAAG